MSYRVNYICWGKSPQEISEAYLLQLQKIGMDCWVDKMLCIINALSSGESSQENSEAYPIQQPKKNTYHT